MKVGSEKKWMSVMFSNESTMRLVRGAAGYTRVRRLPGTLERYKQKHLLPTVKKPGSVMIWGCFSGNGGRGGLYFLPLNQTMNSKTYLEVLNDHLLLFFRTHRCQFFFKMCALSHCSSG